ncbi:PilN domain-containing protein [candidate division WOR-3 bacterium]|jgi:type IV pilus assembly protein PilN|nr:PilN domain-containing protein [candidate division WOR-3 bacterium]
MIDINLLPEEMKKGKKKELGVPKISMNFQLPVKGGVFAIVGVYVIVIVILLLITMKQNSTMNKLRTEIKSMQTELNSLQDAVHLVKQFRQKQQDLQHKIGIVEKLNVGRLNEAKILDNLALSVPDYMWLVNVKQSGNQLVISGITFSNVIVADFMKNLENNPYFGNVTLKVIEKKNLLEHDIMEFKLSCSIKI